MSVSTERLDELIKVWTRIGNRQGDPASNYKRGNVDPWEAVDIFRDAKAWREHVRPPKRRRRRKP